MLDIVIPVKTSYINEELRYTLRSIAKNMPGHKIWLLGYKPVWLDGPVEFIRVEAPVSNKYRNVAASIRTACKDNRISENFLLFNDDFFVVKPVTEHTDFKRCPITDSIERLSSLNSHSKTYLNSLKLTDDILRRMGFDNPADYGLHIPITYNRKKWLKAWNTQLEHNPEKLPVHMRTIYGNMYDLAQDFMNDIKISNLEDSPTGDETYLSANDSSFTQGKIGEYIRERFQEVCIYEGTVNNTFVLK
jgi:hypothetical protein